MTKAEGNPDEEKIGAFGVGVWSSLVFSELPTQLKFKGFYSLFSITEEPFVTSGGMFLSILLLSA